MKKIDKSSEKIFFTADPHFGHEWIRKFNNRPFISMEEMDKVLIENWNKVVPTDGLTFVLGDIGSTDEARIVEIFQQLNGEKVLIRGNHDDDYSDDTLHAIFSEVYDILYLRVKDDDLSMYNYMVLCHYPMLDWQNSFEGSWQLFGHIHTREEVVEFKTVQTKLFDTQYDVGVDNNDFHPISFHSLKKIIENQRGDTNFKQSNYY